MAHKILRIIPLVLLFVMNYGLAHSTDFGPYKGKIIDADTKEPIEGVVVLVEWWEIPFLGGPKYLDAQETLTDKNGAFHVQGIWVLNPMKRMGADVIMTIFKSGYQFHQWNFHNWKEISPEVDGSILKSEDGIPVIMLKMLTMEERRKQRPPIPSTKAPLNKIRMMLNEINKNEISLGAEPYDIWGGEKVYEKN